MHLLVVSSPAPASLSSPAGYAFGPPAWPPTHARVQAVAVCPQQAFGPITPGVPCEMKKSLRSSAPSRQRFFSFARWSTQMK